jgi:hypothetical protein
LADQIKVLNLRREKAEATLSAAIGTLRELFCDQVKQFQGNGYTLAQHRFPAGVITSAVG